MLQQKRHRAIPITASVLLGLLLLGGDLGHGYTLDLQSTGERPAASPRPSEAGESADLARFCRADSIIEVSKQLTADLVSFYNGNQPNGIPGLLPAPYYCE